MSEVVVTPADGIAPPSGATSAPSLSPALGGHVDGSRASWPRIRQFLSSLHVSLRHPRRLFGIGTLVSLIALGFIILGIYLWWLYHLRSGRSALEQYHHAEAMAHLQACLRVWPKERETLLLMARAARRTSAFDAAQQYLEQYRQAHGLTEELVLEQTLQVAAKGEVDKVGEYCLKLVQQDSPATELILEALIQGCLRTHRLVEAHALLKRWLERQPANTQALLFQAELYAEMSRRDDVISTCQRILQLDPEHDAARLRLALVLMESSKYQEAAPYLDRLQQRQPDNPMMLVLRARCLDYLGRRVEAQQLLEEILAKNPHFAPALAERGRLAVLNGQPAEAEPWLREAVALEPGDHQSRYNLALCLLQNGKEGEAEKEQRQLKKLELDLNRLRVILTKEMSQKSTDPPLHYELAIILLNLGQTEEALRWLHRVLQEDPHYVPAHRVLAEYYQRIGNRERATYHRQFLSPEGLGNAGMSPRG